MPPAAADDDIGPPNETVLGKHGMDASGESEHDEEDDEFFSSEVLFAGEYF